MGCHQSKELPIQPVIAHPITEPSSIQNVSNTIPNVPNSIPTVDYSTNKSTSVLPEIKYIEVLFCASDTFSNITPLLNWTNQNLHLTAFGSEADYAKDTANHSQYYFEEFLYDGETNERCYGEWMAKDRTKLCLKNILIRTRLNFQPNLNLFQDLSLNDWNNYFSIQFQTTSDDIEALTNIWDSVVFGFNTDDLVELVTFRIL
jgi:hypothetical protein